MNRWDQIKGAALDVAHHVTQDPTRREAMADDLITLVGLMINAVGKGVAITGETDLNEVHERDKPWDDGSYDPTPEEVAEFEVEQRVDAATAHARYLTGESIQRQVNEVIHQSQIADLERWEKMGPNFGWRPRCVECGRRNIHKLDCSTGRSKCVVLSNGQGPSCDWDPDRPNCLANHTEATGHDPGAEALAQVNARADQCQPEGPCRLSNDVVCPYHG